MCIRVYPGQYYDQETGFHYNGFRFYDPGTGRYLTPDPIGQLGGINLFLYAEENPINHIDPLGLQGSTTFPGTGIPIPIVPVFIPGTPENKQFVKDTEWAIEQIRRFFHKPDPYDIEKAKRNFKNINVPTVRDMGVCEEIPPPDDDCIGGCRKKYSGSFTLRQICILGCILAAF